MNGIQLGTIEGISCKMIECNVSNEASQYISDNYAELIVQVAKMGVTDDKASDLVHDVYISIVNAENNGEGFDENKGKDGEFILVKQFVYGRLKGYSKNERYAQGTTSYMEISTNTQVGDNEGLSFVQKAYVDAATVDEIELAEERLSIKDKIEFCEEFGHATGIDMLTFFRKIHTLAAGEFDKSLFAGLKSAAKYHDEFGEALREILEFAISNRVDYDTILCGMQA